MNPSPRQMILIIDDNKELLSALNDYFSGRAYDVISAPNGLEGIKLLEADENKIDLVITDLVMPHISGVGVIAIVKKKFPETPIIAITGWGEHPEKLAAEAQADLILEKPFELAELERHIGELLAK